MRVFIGMETSGRSRSAFQAIGHWVVSCDLLPAQDGSLFTLENGGHIQGDVFSVLEQLSANGIEFDLAIFHPDCTYLTGSAEWAYGDGPYHQKVKPGTLVGVERRAAREDSLKIIRKIMTLPISRIAIENPVGCISSRIRKPDQIIQPYDFGDDASKKTCLWLKGLPKLKPTCKAAGRLVQHNGRTVERWSNQTDSGQNKLPPSKDRWSVRSDTYPGIAKAFALQWGQVVPPIETFYRGLMQLNAAK